MILSWIGLIMGIVSIIGGQVLEGGHLSSIIQPTAAIIVLGGTFGATLLASTVPEFIGACKAIPKAFLGKKKDPGGVIKEIVALASNARKEGILGLERYVAEVKNPFMSSNLRHIIDGYDPEVVKTMMEDRFYKEEEEKTAFGKVWETAGGFAPTIGILGAVLGLIHVMENLSDSSKLGSGIAVAFVATVYGVGGANLILIPLGNKLKKIAKEEMLEMELIMTGLIGIQAGLNPRVIEDRLNNLLIEHKHGDSAAAGGKGAPEKKAA